MTVGCWGVQSPVERGSTLVEAPQAPDRRASHRWQSDQLKRAVGLDLEKDSQARLADLKLADEWQEKAMEIRKASGKNPSAGAEATNQE